MSSKGRIFKFVTFVAALAGTTLSLPAAHVLGQREQQLEERQMDLSVGEQTTVPAKKIKSYSEGVPGIVDVRLMQDGSRFIIVAMRPGNTSLLLITDNGQQIRYNITVSGSGSDGRVKETGGVPERENIRLDFYFVQVSDSYQHQIGIGWPGTIGGAGVGQGSATFDLLKGQFTGATAAIANQVLPRLDIAQSNGWAKILRQAAVVTANGNEAQFSSGGEVNISVQGALTADIRSIQYGSTVKVTPRYDAKTGRIDLRLQAEVSDLTEDGARGVPGRTRTQLDTIVNLELGQSLILGGLSARNTSKSKSGLPGLSQIPILGMLFGTTGERSQDTENLIFIVPTVVEPVARQRRDLIGEALRVYEDFSGGSRKAGLHELKKTSKHKK